jgi:molybdopterin-guanine dinucleotide biosynthesis protein B
MSPCDLVLVEGYKAAPIPKLEIWRAAAGKPLLYPRDPHIMAIATDTPERLPDRPPERALAVLALDDLDAIATLAFDQARTLSLED